MGDSTKLKSIDFKFRNANMNVVLTLKFWIEIFRNETAQLTVFKPESTILPYL